MSEIKFSKETLTYDIWQDEEIEKNYKEKSEEYKKFKKT